MLDIIEQSSAGDKITVTVVGKNGSTKTLQAVLRANVSESSYTEIETPNANSNTNPENGGGYFNNPGNNGGGSFTFPFGE